MTIQMSSQIKGFFEKNLFERIIIYLFLSEFIVKIVFELALGQWYFEQSQHKQWLFYGFLALDYLLSFKKVINIKVSVNIMSCFALFLFILIAHGLIVGVLSHNHPFEIINDTIPLLMIALNILRFQSYAEAAKPIDFKFLLYIVTILAFATCMIGQLAVTLGKPSVATIPMSPIFYPLFFAGLFMLRPFPKILLCMGAIMFALSLSELNRTTMALILLIMTGYGMIEILKNPSKGVLLILAGVTILSIGWAFIPEDSKAYRRIVGLTELDFSKRTGSVGERQEEFDSIRRTLEIRGQTAELVGAGFGGVYEAQFTHKYVKNYGHAHYIWAWFNLRFGAIGYVYMCIFMTVLMLNMLKGFRMHRTLGTYTALLCLCGLLYCLTYVNAVFLASGLHFFHLNAKEKDAA